MFRRIKREQATVQPKDAFKKLHSVESTWVVERLLEFPDIPLHVRLIEQGGNNRTVTVALSQLLDNRAWARLAVQDKKET